MYADLDRPPLDERALTRALVADGSGLWTQVRVLAETTSTNAVAAQAARDGADEGLVVVAEHQSAGRGRSGRAWSSPPRAGLMVSVLLRPQVVAAEWGWLPLLAGRATRAALADHAGLAAELKWPNDLLVGDRKLAGLLVEVPTPDCVVVGLGLNVSTTAAELPEGVAATSLALAGAGVTDRSLLLRAVLRAWAADYEAWHVSPGPLREAYRTACGTLGRQVRVHLPGGRVVTGTAGAVDDEGRLVVDGVPYAAGDVVHLRAV